MRNHILGHFILSDAFAIPSKLMELSFVRDTLGSDVLLLLAFGVPMPRGARENSARQSSRALGAQRSQSQFGSGVLYVRSGVAGCRVESWPRPIPTGQSAPEPGVAIAIETSGYWG